MSNVSSIAKIFARQVEEDTPERRLFLAIIIQSVRDLEIAERDAHYESAVEYFRGKDHVYHCDLVGLNPEWVVEVLEQQKLLPKEVH